jgi:hypothetical protein
MTPAEKAKELYMKFYGIPLYIKTVKQCCYIAIDERIDEMYEWMGGGGYEWEKSRFQYWEEVKKEIEKL